MKTCRYCLCVAPGFYVTCPSAKCREALRSEVRAKHLAKLKRYRLQAPRAQPASLRGPERIATTLEWLRSRYFGATKAVLVEQFPEFWGECRPHSSDERRFCRDIQKILAEGSIIHVKGLYIRRERAHVVPDLAA